ncbi:FkbM family methyltransferase [Prochlorococcus marinus]|nr:FkbM family methyltransferase [Prochlorococcus marinus]MBO8217854.1 FkbM family methyltransferase [Prochlorococcus marinus XMU1405]MBW3041011.1 hypothetical protein [Prochlorococcus marinus str. MU1405]
MIPEFIYCYILRPWPLRNITNWIIKKLLPKKVKIKSNFIYLNPNDPVVSGAIFFNVYEKTETNFIKSVCFEGMNVLDIGANIGFYTSIFSQFTGAKGIVVAIEPDKESYKYLSKSINCFNYKNVLSFPIAASDTKQKLPLFISEENRGDNRLYATDQKRNSIMVDCLTIDELLKENKIKNLDLIKIDVQGYEPKVLKGMRKIVKSSEKLILLSEFWPKGISQSGENPREYLMMLRKMEFELFELKNNGSLVLLKPREDDKLIEKYRGRRYTNIIGKKISL